MLPEKHSSVFIMSMVQSRSTTGVVQSMCIVHIQYEATPVSIFLISRKSAISLIWNCIIEVNGANPSPPAP